MSRLAATFRRLSERRELALVTYHTLGFPDMATSESLVEAAVESGADVVELGIPFSDPIADGPTVQHAGFLSLEAGTKVATCFKAAARLRRQVDVPLLFMTYYNLVSNYGVERFCDDSRASGIDGLIMVDLPPEEADELRPPARKRGIDLIPLLAPTSTDERIRVGVEQASGFVYCVSVTGVTGARGALSAVLPEFLGRVRAHTSLPLAVGFGISRPEHVSQLTGLADAAVVGSALVDLVDKTPADQRYEAVRGYVASLKQATARPPAPSAAST